MDHTKLMFTSHRVNLELKNDLYEKSGFTYMGKSNPNYWYVKKLERKHRFNFTKSKLIKDGFPADKSEWEIMKSRGFDRIWDCGNLKYMLKL